MFRNSPDTDAGTAQASTGSCVRTRVRQQSSWSCGAPTIEAIPAESLTSCSPSTTGYRNWKSNGRRLTHTSGWDRANAYFPAVWTLRFWVSVYCTKWRTHGNSHSSSSLSLNVKTWPRSSILGLDTHWLISSMHLLERNLCIWKTELALAMKFYLDFYWEGGRRGHWWHCYKGRHVS